MLDNGRSLLGGGALVVFAWTNKNAKDEGAV
jgi:hypothetical protein